MYLYLVLKKPDMFPFFFFVPVSQLREHWEDTSSKVMSRRNQLEDLLVDNQQFESKRREVEAWLGRMEGWQARMRPVGSTQEVMEQQVREQKVSKGCVTRYAKAMEPTAYHYIC